MSKRILCKFFAQGTCLKGDHCQFSHDWRDQSSNVCNFYQKGVCSYGSRCRYKHVKVSRPRHQTSLPSSLSSSLNYRPQMVSSSAQVTHPSSSSSSNSHPHMVSNSAQVFHSSSSSSSSSNSRPHIPSGAVQVTHPSSGNLESRERSNLSKLSPINKSVWIQKREVHTLPNSSNGHSPASNSLADQPICSFAAAGSCPNGEKCPHIHGDLCSICGKHCLHPYRPNEREEHAKICQENNKHLEALKLSQEIECSVCFDRVLSKPTPSERKFGLLSECDHPFCVSCIRKWRSNSPTSGMDVDSALRACPICRKPSYFVIPSAIWYSSQEEKQEIINTYKNKLRSIDCKYFDFGNGACPFGTSCFYRHTYKPYANRSRRNSFRPPRRHRPSDSVMEDTFLMDVFEQLALEEDFEDLDYDDFTDPLRYMAEEDPEGFLEYALLVNLMNMESHDGPSGDEDEDDEDDDEYEEDEDHDEDHEEN